MEGMIRIKLYRSPICTPAKHKRVVKGLGLRKLNQIVEREDTPSSYSWRISTSDGTR